MRKKALPVWLIILLLVVIGAGAAAGTVLAGKVTGEVPVAVSQALLVESPYWLTSLTADVNQPQQVNVHHAWVSFPNRSFGAAADDNTAFQAAAELAVGDWVAFNLPLKNASSVNLTGILTLDVPGCLEVEVYADSTATHVTEVTRVDCNTWVFKLDSAAHYDTVLDVLTVVISIDDMCPPGYFNITGKIAQTSIGADISL